MRVTLTYASLPSGPMITQYGVRAPITLDSDSLGYPQNYGRDGWNDSTTPRTADPVRFQYRRTSVWCDPRATWESATWTDELRTIGYYRR